MSKFVDPLIINKEETPKLLKVSRNIVIVRFNSLVKNDHFLVVSRDIHRQFSTGCIVVPHDCEVIFHGNVDELRIVTKGDLLEVIEKGENNG